MKQIYVFNSTVVKKFQFIESSQNDLEAVITWQWKKVETWSLYQMKSYMLHVLLTAPKVRKYLIHMHITHVLCIRIQFTCLVSISFISKK